MIVCIAVMLLEDVLNVLILLHVLNVMLDIMYQVVLVNYVLVQ